MNPHNIAGIGLGQAVQIQGTVADAGRDKDNISPPQPVSVGSQQILYIPAAAV